MTRFEVNVIAKFGFSSDWIKENCRFVKNPDDPNAEEFNRIWDILRDNLPSSDCWDEVASTDLFTFSKVREHNPGEK